MNKIRYPRSSARPIYVTAGMFGMLGLAGMLVMLVAMADVPKPSYYLLIAAFGMLLVALAGALAVLLATNTRRPWGVDPNVEMFSAPHMAAERPAESAPSLPLLREATLLPDGPYGRRKKDDPEVVRRLTSGASTVKAPTPPAQKQPAWVDEILPADYREQRAAEPETAEFAEVPIDQLDLLSSTPEPAEQPQTQLNGQHSI